MSDQPSDQTSDQSADQPPPPAGQSPSSAAPAGPTDEGGRRSFLGKLALWLGLGSSYGTFAAMVVRYLYPAQRPPRWRSIFVARLDQIPDGGTRPTQDLNGVPVQVVRQGDSLRALSTVCPHLGCRVRWEPQKSEFLCPCHTAAFDRDGKRLYGPAPRDLDRYQVELVSGSVYLKMKEKVS